MDDRQATLRIKFTGILGVFSHVDPKDPRVLIVAPNGIKNANDGPVAAPDDVLKTEGAPKEREFASSLDYEAQADGDHIYEHLTELKRRGEIDGPLVISNSCGLRRREPPTRALEDDPLAQVVLAAVDEGIPVVFGAGNHHHDELCRHDPTAAEPSTIWGVNSLDQVISVGAVDWNESNQDPTSSETPPGPPGRPGDASGPGSSTVRRRCGGSPSVGQPAGSHSSKRFPSGS